MNMKKPAWEVDSNGCWICTSHRKDTGGYPHAIREGKSMRVSHMMLGGVPKGKIVLHSCDVPACINPAHLRVGTHLENSRDRQQRNRTAIGEKCGSAVLTEELVRRLRNEKGSIAAIARKYNLAYNTVGHAIRRISWAHV